MNKIQEQLWGFLSVPLGSDVYDARLVVSQIVLLQCQYYFLLGILLVFLDLFLGRFPCLDQIFSYQALSFRSLFGVSTFICQISNGFLGAIALYFIVQRSKKCLDFSVTLYVFHFILCTFIKSFPMGFEWWIVNIFNVLVMAILGEFLCYRRELQSVSLRDSSSSQTQVTESHSV